MKTLIDRLQETTNILVPRNVKYHYPSDAVMRTLRTHRGSMGKTIHCVFELGSENNGVIMFVSEDTHLKYDGDLEGLERYLDTLTPLTLLRGREIVAVEKSENQQ